MRIRTAATFCLILSLCTSSCRLLNRHRIWRIQSPDNGLILEIRLDQDLAAPDAAGDATSLSYRILAGSKKAEVLGYSPLGIRRLDQNFLSGLRCVSDGEMGRIDETYTLLHGKRKMNRFIAHERILSFENGNGAKLELQARVCDEGVAFRYRFPGGDKKIFTVNHEATGFQVPAGSSAYMLPHDDAGQWTPAYENVFTNGIPAGTQSPTETGWDFPALFKTPDGHWLLITESGLDGGYCGCRLSKTAPNCLYTLRFPDSREGNETGEVFPKSRLPWSTPWRIVMVGDSPGDIVESSMVTDLAAPPDSADTGYIKPGRASWSWWSESDNPPRMKTLSEFVDLAAEMGWEYSLVDANWNKLPDKEMRGLCEYASSKGIGIWLWYNSGGPHNIVTEEPRDRLFGKADRRREFRRLRELGVRGVKVDFWHSDKQNIIQYYIALFRDAAEHGILVNTHGCTLPRGWERTFPNLLSMESVRGAESYKFDAAYPERAPWHNTILVFTRNAVGPMDYTPVAFSDQTYPHLTTWAHELALSVIFETGILHFADKPSSYRGLTEGPLSFLKNVPVAWDQTRCLHGEPGKDAVLARQKGSIWYLGGINGENSLQSLSLDLKFLGPGKYRLHLLMDGKDSRSFSEKTAEVKGTDRIEVSMLPYGGFAGVIEPVI